MKLTFGDIVWDYLWPNGRPSLHGRETDADIERMGTVPMGDTFWCSKGARDCLADIRTARDVADGRMSWADGWVSLVGRGLSPKQASSVLRDFGADPIRNALVTE